MAVKTLPVRGGSRGQTVIGKSTGTPLVHSCYTYEGNDLETQPDVTKMVDDYQQEQDNE